MAHVNFTPHLKRFFPALAPCEIEAANVREVVEALDRLHPGIASYVVDETVHCATYRDVGTSDHAPVIAHLRDAPRAA